jgi:hypothetical protein
MILEFSSITLCVFISSSSELISFNNLINSPWLTIAWARSEPRTIYNMLKIGFNSWYYYFINSIFQEKMEEIKSAYSGLIPTPEQGLSQVV